MLDEMFSNVCRKFLFWTLTAVEETTEPIFTDFARLPLDDIIALGLNFAFLVDSALVIFTINTEVT